MKLVTAILQPAALEQVQVALARFGVKGMTVSEVSGYARQHGHQEVYRGEEFDIDFIAKVRVEVLCSAEEAQAIVDIICTNARSGRVGDGKVWLIDVEDVVRIRTGERGTTAV